MIMRVLAGAVLAIGVSITAQAQKAKEDAALDAIADLNWQIGAASHHVQQSNAYIHTKDDEAFLKGKDAHEFMRLSEGHDEFKPDALVVYVDGPLADSLVMYLYSDIGYVKMDDWEEQIDPSELISMIQKKTKEQNEQRAEGYPHVFVDGWAEQPSLNRQSATVYWATKVHSEDGTKVVNATAIKLGRNGMSIITWMGSSDQFVNANTNLEPALQAYQHQEGFRYADFQPGADTVAAVGVGAIAYNMLTGSNKKGAAAAGAGILAVIMAFAKKLWFLLLLPLVCVWKGIKRLFTGTNEKQPIPLADVTFEPGVKVVWKKKDRARVFRRDGLFYVQWSLDGICWQTLTDQGPFESKWEALRLGGQLCRD